MEQRILSEASIDLVTTPGPTIGPRLLCTGSRGPHWLTASGLPVDGDGRLRTDALLRVEGCQQIFASGDCAVIAAAPRPASGVWAVRASNPLANNLERLSRQQPLRSWRPQQRALQLLGCPMPGQTPSAWLIWGSIWAGPHRWIWRWKRHLDQRFMDMLQPNDSMVSAESEAEKTSMASAKTNSY